MKKTVDFEALPTIIHQCLGIPKHCITVENDPAHQYSGVRITNNAGQHVTFWYDWQERKIREMKISGR